MNLRLLIIVLAIALGCGEGAEDTASTVAGDSLSSGQAGGDDTTDETADATDRDTETEKQDTSEPGDGDVEIPTYPEPDVFCSEASECEVKDVGSCCGSYPKCVNLGYEPDKKALAAYCQENEVSSTCEIPDVTGCDCVDERCVASDGDPM